MAGQDLKVRVEPLVRAGSLESRGGRAGVAGLGLRERVDSLEQAERRESQGSVDGRAGLDSKG